jgi:hypothetical protein
MRDSDMVGAFADPTMNDATACLRENWQVTDIASFKSCPGGDFNRLVALAIDRKVHDKRLSDK